MSATIWSNFYWSDWLSDSGLRRSSLAARGLWIDMLCIAAQADPIGYLAVKQHPLTVHDIARMVGGSAPEVETLIEELERNGVFSRDRNGTIYSRRMIRDEKKKKISTKNGKLGGNPSLGNKKDISASDNPRDKGDVNTQSPESKESTRQSAEKKKDKDQNHRDYAFASGVIQLNELDLARWKKAFPAINVEGELVALTDWAAQQRNWFAAVSGALAKKDRDARLAVERLRIEVAAGNDPRRVDPRL